MCRGTAGKTIPQPYQTPAPSDALEKTARQLTGRLFEGNCHRHCHNAHERV
jgi:hypothetical protein